MMMKLEWRNSSLAGMLFQSLRHREISHQAWSQPGASIDARPITSFNGRRQVQAPHSQTPSGQRREVQPHIKE